VHTDLVAYVSGRGHHVEAITDATEILLAVARQHFDLILIDVELAGADDFALLREIHRHRPDVAVALTTDHASVAEAVQAMRAGARYYLAKPLSPRQVEGLLRQLVGAPSPALEEVSHGRIPDAPPFLESANATMAATIASARQLADSDVPLLLTGESGTGKRTLAAAIHSWSERRTAPFVTVWTAALTPHATESGLLEQLAGAMSGARKGSSGRPLAVDGGTLYFDEVGNERLPPALQVRLLHLLEEQRFSGGLSGPSALEVDARIITASAQDLEAEVLGGRLRRDLFFRLNTVTLSLPPLRERREDLPQLSDHLLQQVAARHSRGTVRLTAEAHDVLIKYDWPGNVQELLSVLEHAVVLSHGKAIGAPDLPPKVLQPTPSKAPPPEELLSLGALEQREIQLALEESATFGEAAARLGIDPATLWRKRKRYGWGRRRRAQTGAKPS
jgi:NtrC-family two-component system response regulator AlgB